MGGLTLTIKLISAQLNYAAAGAGLSLAKDNCIYGAEKCWFVHAENIEQAFEIAKTVTTNNILKDNKKFTDMKT